MASSYACNDDVYAHTHAAYAPAGGHSARVLNSGAWANPPRIHLPQASPYVGVRHFALCHSLLGVGPGRHLGGQSPVSAPAWQRRVCFWLGFPPKCYPVQLRCMLSCATTWSVLAILCNCVLIEVLWHNVECACYPVQQHGVCLLSFATVKRQQGCRLECASRRRRDGLAAPLRLPGSNVMTERPHMTQVSGDVAASGTGEHSHRLGLRWTDESHVRTRCRSG